MAVVVMSTYPKRRIIGFHQDEESHWVAELECGHSQHMRHQPPWTVRPWVLTPEGRAGFIGVEIPCRLCGEPGSPEGPRKAHPVSRR